MQLLNAEQIREWDQFTIANEPITSFDLMKRASLSFTNWFCERYKLSDTVLILCGQGNNGGDGLCIAKYLWENGYKVSVIICCITGNESLNFKKSCHEFSGFTEQAITYLHQGDVFPNWKSNSVVIDAILGSGINRPVTGYWGTFIDDLNHSGRPIMSVDIPSGMYPDKHTGTISVHATNVFSFQTPKLAFLMPENASRLQDFEFDSIGLHQDFLKTIPDKNIYIQAALIHPILKSRHKFDHKGTYGHALLVCGSKGKAGAAVLASKACLRSGVGLMTVHSPASSIIILQTSVPEAMVSVDNNTDYISEIPDTKEFNAIGIGCGIDKQHCTTKALEQLLNQYPKPIVIDADALNIISENQHLLLLIPKQSILTPHPKEFERLFGKAQNDFSRLELLRSKAIEFNLYIILKGAHTTIATPEGVCYFNSTGNPGMATGGSGDVLTGIITGLLARGYSPQEAALIGVYEHGLAGDRAADQIGQEPLIATDIINNLRF